MSTVELTKENFDEMVARHEMLILDFWAEWCGPCKSFGPIFSQVSEQYPDILFGKINTEEQPELAQDFRVRSIPLVVVLRQNIAVFSQPGMLPASALVDIIEQAKALDMDEVRASIARDSEE